MGGFNDGAGDSASSKKDGRGDSGSRDNERSGSSGDNLNDSRLGGRPSGRGGNESSVGDGRNGESRGTNSLGSRGENSENGGQPNGETNEPRDESEGGGGEGGGEGGQEQPPDCDPVRDEAIPRPPRRHDHDYVWPIPVENPYPPTSKISASGGYNTQIRPGGSSSVDAPIVGVSGGGSVLPVLTIGP